MPPTLISIVMVSRGGVTGASLLYLDDQLRPGLRSDDPVGAQPARGLKGLHGGLRQWTEDTVHPVGWPCAVTRYLTVVTSSPLDHCCSIGHVSVI